jgi:hypothetical protein
MAHSKVATEGDLVLKQWKCVKVGNHNEIHRTIEEWQKDGWCLHTYQAIGTSGNPSHYLLFEKGE